jgi:aspartate kinase
MFPAQLCSYQLSIRVRNSYNLKASGSTICDDRDIANSLLTSIVLKPDVKLLDVVSTRMLGNFGFLARVFDIFKQEEISVDVVATSEISVSVTLDCARLWSRELIAEELDHLARRFEGVAKVKVASDVSIISLICNAARSSEILKRVCPPATLGCLCARLDKVGVATTSLTQSVHAVAQSGALK